MISPATRARVPRGRRPDGIPSTEPRRPRRALGPAFHDADRSEKRIKGQRSDSPGRARPRACAQRHDGVVALRQLQGMSVAARAHRARSTPNICCPRNSTSRRSRNLAGDPPRGRCLRRRPAQRPGPGPPRLSRAASPACNFSGPLENGDRLRHRRQPAVRGPVVPPPCRVGSPKIGLADFGYSRHRNGCDFAGYVTTLTEFDVTSTPPTPEFLEGLPPHEERVRLVADHVAKRARDAGVRAWVCTDDFLGYTFVAALQDRGLRCPRT